MRWILAALVALPLVQTQPHRNLTANYDMWSQDGHRVVLVRPGADAKKHLDEICAKQKCARKYLGELWSVEMLDASR